MVIRYFSLHSMACVQPLGKGRNSTKDAELCDVDVRESKQWGKPQSYPAVGPAKTLESSALDLSTQLSTLYSLLHIPKISAPPRQVRAGAGRPSSRQRWQLKVQFTHSAPHHV